MMAVVYYVTGFIFSLFLIGFFSASLRNAYTGGFELVAFISLDLLSGFGAIFFFLLLIAHFVRQFARTQTQTLPPVASAHYGPPQSTFAQRWGKRNSATYEHTFYESRVTGEQRPYRLKCVQINSIRSRSGGGGRALLDYGYLGARRR